MYADGLVLNAFSLTLMQKMIKICETEANNSDLIFSAYKSLASKIIFQHPRSLWMDMQLFPNHLHTTHSLVE